jgi:hypothetical protein
MAKFTPTKHNNKGKKTIKLIRIKYILKKYSSPMNWRIVTGGKRS